MTLKTQRRIWASTTVAALTLGLALSVSMPARASDANDGVQCRALAQHMLDALAQGDSRGATRSFDSDMRSALPPPKLAELWQQVRQNYGDLKARGDVQTMQVNGMDVVITPMQFSKSTLDAQIACNPQRQIAGFFLRPVSA